MSILRHAHHLCVAFLTLQKQDDEPEITDTIAANQNQSNAARLPPTLPIRPISNHNPHPDQNSIASVISDSQSQGGALQPEQQTDTEPLRRAQCSVAARVRDARLEPAQCSVAVSDAELGSLSWKSCRLFRWELSAALRLCGTAITKHSALCNKFSSLETRANRKLQASAKHEALQKLGTSS